MGAIFVVAAIAELSDLKSKDKFEISFGVGLLLAALYLFYENASEVGVDLGVVFCVILAWLVVPLMSVMELVFGPKTTITDNQRQQAPDDE